MTYKVTVLEDSIGKPHNIRLTTIEATFPRFILAELNTHRMLSRNSASSRAIPTTTLINSVKSDPVVPARWGSNQRGMQAGDDIEDTQHASSLWLEARDKAVFIAGALSRLGVHKQLVNRILEPFMWHTAIISATDWRNFLHLRTRADAQPEMQTLALLIRRALVESTPELLDSNQWHLPHVLPHERETLAPLTAACVSAARCARVSYNRKLEYDTAKDIELADKLQLNGHMSPFEHPAMCLLVPADWGNFIGWKQYRKFIPNEDDPLGGNDGNFTD
jgi:thymidylate synthase ThyX